MLGQKPALAEIACCKPERALFRSEKLNSGRAELRVAHPDTVVDGHGRGTVVDTGTVAWHGALGTVVRARSWISTVTVLDTHSRGHRHGRTIAA